MASPYGAVPDPEDALSVPDQLGPVEGWRVWRVADGGYLLPVGMSPVAGAWSSREDRPAECLSSELGPAHPVAAADCGCGYWIMSDPASLVDQFYVALREGTMVMGRVKGWGRVMPMERGWRTEYARPLSLVRCWYDGRSPWTDQIAAIRLRYPLSLHDPPEAVARALGGQPDAALDALRNIAQHLQQMTPRTTVHNLGIAPAPAQPASTAPTREKGRLRRVLLPLLVYVLCVSSLGPLTIATDSWLPVAAFAAGVGAMVASRELFAAGRRGP